jgi:hypothetical protein
MKDAKCEKLIAKRRRFYFSPIYHLVTPRFNGGLADTPTSIYLLYKTSALVWQM